MFTEDLDAFLADFCLVATYTPNSGSAVSKNVIKDETFLAQYGVTGTNPVALGKATDFTVAGSIGATIVIDSTTYTIRGREPVDDGAFVLLQLRQS